MADWVTLNVGGTKFTTTRATLTSEPDSMFARMFQHERSMQPAAQDKEGAYLIDRNPKYFEPILNFLRSRELFIDPGISLKGVLSEAKYFGIQSLVTMLEDNNNEPPTEKEGALKLGSYVSITLPPWYIGSDDDELKGIVKHIDHDNWTIKIEEEKRGEMTIHGVEIDSLSLMEDSFNSFLLKIMTGKPRIVFPPNPWD